jgi:SAM-dependent methyltransferase
MVRYFRIAGSRPFVISGGATLPVRLHAASHRTIDETREREWKRWFSSWQQRPLSARSTGCYEATEKQLAAAAASIASLLELNESDTVLDMGCDSALISRRVAPHCGRFAGVDFMAEMLPQAVSVMPRRAAPTWFIAGDGRHLPIRDAAFGKVFCSGVLHTLPSEAHGLAMIEELIRVTADGGTVLLASVPDRRKRRANRLLVWKRASLGGKLTLPIRWTLPASVRKFVRNALGLQAAGPPAFLDYDCRKLGQWLETRGMSCVLHDFPGDFPNLDFRVTRTNLVISVRH